MNDIGVDDDIHHNKNVENDDDHKNVNVQEQSSPIKDAPEVRNIFKLTKKKSEDNLDRHFFKK